MIRVFRDMVQYWKAMQILTLDGENIQNSSVSSGLAFVINEPNEDNIKNKPIP